MKWIKLFLRWRCFRLIPYIASLLGALQNSIYRVGVVLSLPFHFGEQRVADLRTVDEEIRAADKLRNNLQQYIAVMPVAQLVLKQLQGFDPAFDRGIAQIRQQLCPVTQALAANTKRVYLIDLRILLNISKRLVPIGKRLCDALLQ